MKGTRAAIRYAKAILDLAKDKNLADAVNSDMLDISNTINDSKELRLFLQNPIIKPSVKIASLKEIFSKTNTITLDAFDVLLENKRIGLLNNIALNYTKIFDELNGNELATVTTATALTDDLRKKVLAKAKELTGKNATLTSVVDASIIGGFILRVGDLQYNASVLNNLNKLKREFSISK